MLGYVFDIIQMEKILPEHVLSFEQKQLKEFELISNQYKKIGVEFDLDNISFNPKKESCRRSFHTEIRKYKRNEKFFLFTEKMDNLSSFTRREVFNPQSLLYIDMTTLFPTLEKTVKVIHETKGIALMAHLFQYTEKVHNDLDVIIKNYNLDGIEVYYTTFSKQQTAFLLEYTNKNCLLVSGGSDFHGGNKKGHNMGVGNGNLKIPEEILEKWCGRIYTDNI